MIFELKTGRILSADLREPDNQLELFAGYRLQRILSECHCYLCCSLLFIELLNSREMSEFDLLFDFFF